MQISIVTPVYNAETFVREAVESALIQPETHEIILVEDRSEDDSYAVCQALLAEHDRVKLYTHPDHTNRGAGASRNLGIEKASCEWIGFLDADDIYCERRFSHVRDVLQTCPWADGIYDATGVFFETKAAETAWLEKKSPLLTTMTRVVSPEALFEEMAPIGDAGYWHLDGWLVRKCLLERAGLFDEHLRLHQDTALCLKAAAIGKFVPGNLRKPGAMRRVHDNNRITARRTVHEAYDARCLMWATLWCWSKKRMTPRRRRLILKRWLDDTHGPSGGGVSFESEFEKLWASLGLAVVHPSIALNVLYWKRLLIQTIVMTHAAAKRA